MKLRSSAAAAACGRGRTTQDNSPLSMQQMVADVDVVIIGAGAAGIAAARQLAASHLSAIVLEATARVRRASLDLRSRGYATSDLGCGWLHSADRNPWDPHCRGGRLRGRSSRSCVGSAVSGASTEATSECQGHLHRRFVRDCSIRGSDLDDLTAHPSSTAIVAKAKPRRSAASSAALAPPKLVGDDPQPVASGAIWQRLKIPLPPL